jgi:hypothetical protein
MSDTENDVPSGAEASAELKSTDTREVVEVKAEPEPGKPEPKTEAGEEKPDGEQPEGHEKSPEGGEDDAPAAEPGEGKRKRLPRWMKERLERERQVTEARTRAQVLEELQAKEAKPEAEAPAQVREKGLEDFDFDYDAYTQYKVERAIESRDQQRQAEEESRKQTEAAEAFKARVDAFEERVGDGTWDDILSSPVNLNPAFKPLVDLFMGDEGDLDIAHHLAAHPDEAQRLIELPRLQMVREVVKLAEKFSGEQVDSTPAPIPKKTTNAPPPPKTVSGAGKPSVDIDSPDITTAQRIAEWKRRGAK